MTHFLGVEVTPATLREELHVIQNEIIDEYEFDPGNKVNVKDDAHITLFTLDLSACSKNEIKELAASLNQIILGFKRQYIRENLTATAIGFECFKGESGFAHVLYLQPTFSIAHLKKLEAIRKIIMEDIDNNFHKRCLNERPNDKWTPHVTVLKNKHARVKQNLQIDGEKYFTKLASSVESLSWVIDKLILFESKSADGDATTSMDRWERKYERIAEFGISTTTTTTT